MLNRNLLTVSYTHLDVYKRQALTKLLREKGTMNGMITTDENYNLDEIIPKLKAYTTGNVVDKVT